MTDPKEQEKDERAPIAKGYAWAVLIMSITMESALLVYFGYLLDHYLKTLPWITLVAAFLAIGVMTLRLLSLIKKIEQSGKKDVTSNENANENVNQNANVNENVNQSDSK